MDKKSIKLFSIFLLIVSCLAFTIPNVPKVKGALDTMYNVTNGMKLDATKSSERRLIFYNMRNDYYYALTQSSGVSSIGFGLYNSSDGTVWNQIAGWFGVTDANEIPADSLSVDYFDNGTHLIFYFSVVSLVGLSYNIECYGHYISDSGTVDYLWGSTVATPTDDGTRNVEICLDRFGYIWVSWGDEFTNKGKQRCSARVGVSDTTYPITAPSWTVQDIYGEKGSGEYSDGITFYNDVGVSGDYFMRTELVKFYETGDVGFIFSFNDESSSPDYSAVKSMILNYDNVSTITEGTIVTHYEMSTDLLGYYFHTSSVVETNNSDCYVSWRNELALPSPVFIEKWDISLDTSSDFGDTTHVLGDTEGHSLSIDFDSTPEYIYVFFVPSLNKDEVYYDVSIVGSSAVWEGVQQIPNPNSINLDHVSLGEWGYDYKIYGLCTEVESGAVYDIWFYSGQLIKINITYYYTINGTVRLNGEDIVNGTSYLYLNNTEITLEALPMHLIAWDNFTFHKDNKVDYANFTNPNANILLDDNGTVWCYFFNTTGLVGNGGIVIMTVFIPDNALLILDIFFIILAIVGLKIGFVGLISFVLSLLVLTPTAFTTTEPTILYLSVGTILVTGILMIISFASRWSER